MRIAPWPCLMAVAFVSLICLASRDGFAADAPPDPTVATVEGDPITASEIHLALSRDGKPAPPPEQKDRAESEALEGLIEARVAEQAARAAGTKVTDAELDQALEELGKQLESQKLPLDQALAQAGLTPLTLRAQITRSVLLKKYLNEQMNEQALEAYFKLHKADYDGSEARVSHILFRPERGATNRANIERAAKLRARIEKGELTFTDAAKQFSDGPSRQRGGDLGFFPRHGVMDPEFSRIAFALKKGEMSQPVVTPFGVHLILLAEIKPGERPWTDAREAIANDLGQSLLLDLAKKGRASAKIEYTGAGPHYKPGTKEVVPANPAPKQ